MVNLKNGKKACRDFRARLQTIRAFVENCCNELAESDDLAAIHEYAFLSTVREFEKMVFDLLVSEIQRNGSVISDTIANQHDLKAPFRRGIRQQYLARLLIIKYSGGKFFTLGNVDGMEELFAKFVESDCYLRSRLLRENREELRFMFAIRNFIAHDSPESVKKARAATGMERKFKRPGHFLKAKLMQNTQRRVNLVGRWATEGNCQTGKSRLECYLDFLVNLASTLETDAQGT